MAYGKYIPAISNKPLGNFGSYITACTQNYCVHQALPRHAEPNQD